MKRPTGVSVIAVLLWIVGLANIFAGIGVMNDVSGALGAFEVIIGIAAIVFGIGCWKLQRWARMGTILLMGLNAISLIYLWIQYSDQIIVSRLLIPLSINIIVVIYLLQPSVKAAFGDRSTT